MDELSKTLCSSSYAKDNGVLLYNNDVYIREDTPALALLEVRRVLGRAFVPVTVTPEAFDEMLAKIWQQSSGVSQQLVDDMDADIDLMALTEEIPDNEDLLDNDENSPVIRLINAILGEAVKDGASDIHIETFPHCLFLCVDLHTVNVSDLPLDRFDCLVLIHATDMEADKQPAVRIQQFGEHTVIHFRCADLQKGHGTEFIRHRELPCFTEAERRRCDKILDRQAGRGKPAPFKGKPFPVRV